MTLHPFDPLSAEEIRLSSRVIRDAKPSQDFIFNSITHREPPKKLVLTYLAAKQDGSALPIVPRESFVVLIERGTGDVYEAVVDLQAQVLKSWLHVPGVQPTLTPEDCFEAERIALADEVVKKECAQLGIVDMSLVVADPWFVQNFMASSTMYAMPESEHIP
ncbi:copper amine oxidase [Jimgerdemannia flammicorona]|uniref:Amine oxidase n=1 Tax=Jimgerdemannia flammicorona TaxID=994334 RepID=A0A432ZY92_9FUNG|nr:copper amine oxidase [Jimgerdemannia flammicorona]